MVNFGFSDHLITKVGNFVEDHQKMTWESLQGQKLSLDGKNGDPDVVQFRGQVDVTGKEISSSLSSKVIYMESTPKSGSAEFGIKGHYAVALPEKRFIQFQGVAHVLQGKKQGATVTLQVYVKSELVKEFQGEMVNENGANDGLTLFQLDLSEWSGKEIELVPVLRCKPGYSNIDGKETWNPVKITALWGEANIVASRFGVTLGAMEETQSPVKGKKVNSPQINQANINTVTAVPEVTEEKAIQGSPTYGCLGVNHPGEEGEPSLLLPATQYQAAHYISFFNTPLQTDDCCSARAIDFSGASPIITMATASVSEIRTHIVDDDLDGIADAVLQHDPKNGNGKVISDNWPTYVSITDVINSTIPSSSGSSIPVLNAFVHTEDIYQNDDGSDNPGGHYRQINFARSYGDSNNWGHSFTKMSSRSGTPFISLATPETQISMLYFKNYGCGDPAVFEWGDYYYLLFDTDENVMKNDGSGHVGVPGLCIARALKSQVNVPPATYSASTNPWKKFKEVYLPDLFDARNWVEAGNGGECSYLWNASISGGCRTNVLNPLSLGKWRAYFKVSYNEYLAQLYPNEGHVVLICTGGLGYDPDPNDGVSEPAGVFIHTSTNLINWSEPLLIKNDPIQENMRYPTLVGRNDSLYTGFSSGWNGLTCKDNTLYYQIHRVEGVPAALSQHLYRRKLTFTIN